MDEHERKFRNMTEPPVQGLICRLAVPCIISMLVTAFYNMADTFFVGMMKSNAATAAVGVVFSMMAIIQAVGFFYGHGSGNYISRELGKRNTDEASNMAATGFYFSLATGVLICLVGLIFLEPLALLLGSTKDILPYTKDYLRIILLGAPWMAGSLVLKHLSDGASLMLDINKIVSEREHGKHIIQKDISFWHIHADTSEISHSHMDLFIYKLVHLIHDHVNCHI